MTVGKRFGGTGSAKEGAGSSPTVLERERRPSRSLLYTWRFRQGCISQLSRVQRMRERWRYDYSDALSDTAEGALALLWCGQPEQLQYVGEHRGWHGWVRVFGASITGRRAVLPCRQVGDRDGCPTTVQHAAGGRVASAGDKVSSRVSPHPRLEAHMPDRRFKGVRQSCRRLERAPRTNACDSESDPAELNLIDGRLAPAGILHDRIAAAQFDSIRRFF